MPFLDDIPGIRDLQLENGATLPRRSKLVLFGGVSVADNPALGTTDVTFEEPPASPPGVVTVTLSGDGAATPVTAGDIEIANLLRLEATAERDVHGLDASAPSRVAIANLSAFTLTFQHESLSNAEAHRFLCPSGTPRELGPGELLELVRDPVSNRWRLVT